MIALALASVLAASPEAAFFRAWYPDGFADIKADSPPEASLRAAVGLAQHGRVNEAREALKTFVEGADPEWAVVGALSQARLEHVMSRALDAELEFSCLECEVLYLNQLGSDRDFRPIADRLARLPPARQRELTALKLLADALSFLEEARAPQEIEMMQRSVQESARLLAELPEAQFVVALVWARSAARLGNDGAEVLRRGSASLTGCARAAALDAAAHLELGWAGHVLSLGAPLFAGRTMAMKVRSGQQVPSSFGPSPAIHPVLDEATNGFSQCAASWVKTEHALHAAVLATRANDPRAPGLWLEAVARGRESDDGRAADGAALVHALLTDNPEVAAARLSSMASRGDRAAFMSAVEFVLLVSDTLLAQGDALRADVGWGALESALSGLGSGWRWDATRALVAQRSATMAFTLGLNGRAVVDGERALTTYTEAIHQCEALGGQMRADDLAYVQTVCGLAKGDAFIAAEALRAAYRQAVARGLVPAARSLERSTAIDALRQEWRASIPWANPTSPEPRPEVVTLDRMNELQRAVQRTLLVEGPTCAAWRRVETNLGAELRIADDVGVPQVTGLSYELDARLAACAPAEANRARQRLRRASVEKARAAIPRGAGLQPSALVGHAARAQMVISQALALGEPAIAAQWLELYTELTAATNAPFAPLPWRAGVALQRMRPDEALRLLSGAQPLDPAAIGPRLEAWSQQGEAAQALVAFDAYQAVTLTSAERALGVDRRNPLSAERASLESEEARRGRLSAPERARLEHLRRMPPLVVRRPAPRFEKREDVEAWARALPPEATVLAFHLSGRTVVAWRIERATGVKMVRVPLPSAFTDALVALERGARAGVVDAAEPAELVWKVLLQPLGPITDDRVVVLATSMELSGVLFEALHDAGERPLALRVPVVRAQGLRDLLMVERRKGPAVSYGLAQGGLEHAVGEAADVTARLGGILLRADASRSEVLDAIARARWVHIATHGALDPANPLASTISLSHGESLRVYDFLAVAGGADGIVFSACETSVSGFSALAHAGGARLALATPWPIWDREAAEMTRAYYETLGGDPDTWVAQAPAALLAARRAGAAQGMVDEAAATAFISSVRSIDSLFAAGR